MLEFLQHLVNGISLGSLYALVALGYTLIFGILRLINFAHGDVLMVGAFLGWYTARFLHLGGESSFLGLAVCLGAAVVGCGFLGFMIERWAYRPLLQARPGARQTPRIYCLMTSVGVSLFLEFLGQVLFGVDQKFFPQVYQPNWKLAWGDLRINSLQVTVLGLSILLLLILNAVVFRTRFGTAVRAISFHPETASLMGIPVNRVISWTFILSSALAGAAGVLTCLVYPRIDPMMGTLPGLKAFVAAVLGGIGNIGGTVVGALLLGLAEALLVGYGAAPFRDAVAFGILIGVLLVRPSGLFGSPRMEKV